MKVSKKAARVMKAVVFDIGATLVMGPPVAPNKVIASLIGAEPSDVAAVIMTQTLLDANEVVTALEERFGTLSKHAVDKIIDLWNSQASAAVEIPGATQTVLRLKNRGFKIGLLSDIWTPYYLSVKHAVPNIIEAADTIVLSFQTGKRKPDLFNFVRTLEGLGVQPAEAVMIGDTYEHDILPALELGMFAVWLLVRPERERESLVRILNGYLPRPSATIANILELTELPVLKTVTSAVEEEVC
jgi:FMN phosphatase YigB (HAD superfamily)